jgi:hypothetical protein
MNNTRKKEIKRRQALAMLNSEMKIQYPKGSFIMFSTSHKKGEEPATTSCSWYNKVGGKKPWKHIVNKPPEWQNIPYAEAKKIRELFADGVFMDIVYVPRQITKHSL